jgi:hypothetical protein
MAAVAAQLRDDRKAGPRPDRLSRASRPCSTDSAGRREVSRSLKQLFLQFARRWQDAAGLTEISASLHDSSATRLQRVHLKEKAATATGTSSTDHSFPMSPSGQIRTTDPKQIWPALLHKADLKTNLPIKFGCCTAGRKATLPQTEQPSASTRSTRWDHSGNHSLSALTCLPRSLCLEASSVYVTTTRNFIASVRRAATRCQTLSRNSTVAKMASFAGSSQCLKRG